MDDSIDERPHNEVDPKQVIAYLRARLDYEERLRKYMEGKLLEAQQKIVDLVASLPAAKEGK